MSDMSSSTSGWLTCSFFLTLNMPLIGIKCKTTHQTQQRRSTSIVNNCTGWKSVYLCSTISQADQVYYLHTWLRESSTAQLHWLNLCHYQQLYCCLVQSQSVWLFLKQQCMEKPMTDPNERAANCLTMIACVLSLVHFKKKEKKNPIMRKLSVTIW